MRKFNTKDLDIKIMLWRDEAQHQVICVQYFNHSGELLEEHENVLPEKLCKQNFNDVKLTQNIVNFFIKE